MDIRLLGPVEVAVDGRAVAAGPPRQRSVLAAIAVEAGRPVLVDTVIDRVWGDATPQGVRHALHAYVTRIRQVLWQAGGDVRLVHRAGAYIVDIDPERVDSCRFTGLLDRAGMRPPAERIGLLREALALWRGEPLAGLPGDWAARVRQNWARRRLDAALAWAQAEEIAGEPGATVAALTELADECPLHEPLAAGLMRALHATGRTAEALDRYAATRRLLAEELGVDPSVELQQLHQSILLGTRTRPAAPASPTSAPVPAQLPPDVRGFAGRTVPLARLDALLTTDRPGTVLLSAVSGTAGVGKTTLAVHWAHRVRDRFPDGQLYVNLRGFDPSGAVLPVAQAVRGFLDALGVPPQRVPSTADAQIGLYRSMLADKRMLVVLDNARDAEQVRELLPGTAGCLALVTSRRQLTGLVAGHGAYPVILDLPTRAEAEQLLAARIGPDRVRAEPSAVADIVTRCARLPLALGIVAARAATHPEFSLADLAEELRRSLDALSGDDPRSDVRAVFSWSYQALSPRAARLFRLLALHPGPDLTAAAATSLAGAPTRPALAELAGAHLITEHSPGRFAFHDLLRAYADELVEAEDSAADRRAATHRMLDHYLHTAYAADRLLQPGRDPLALAPPRAGTVAERLTDTKQILAWFTAEHRVLLGVLDLAAANGFDTHAWQIPWTLTDFFNRLGHWSDFAATQHVALAATRRREDVNGQARVHRALGNAYTQLSQYDRAADHLQQALELYRRGGDLTGEAHTHRALGWLLDRQDHRREALVHVHQAAALYQRVGHRVGQVQAMNMAGWCQIVLGEPEQGLASCQHALKLQRELGDRFGEAGILDSIGYAYHHLGRQEQAAACYQDALALLRESGDRYGEADTLSRLGETQQAAGDPATARATWQRALSILEDLGHSDADQVRARLG